MVLERVLESTGLKTSLDGNTDKEILRTAIFRRGMARQNLQDYSGALRDYHSTMDSFKADNEQSSVLSIQDVERKIRTAQRMQAQTEYDKKLVSYMYNTQSCKERPTKSNNLFTLANDSDSEDEAITTTHQIRNLLLSHLTKIITSIESHHEDTLQQDWTPNSIGILDPDTIHTTTRSQNSSAFPHINPPSNPNNVPPPPRLHPPPQKRPNLPFINPHPPPLLTSSLPTTSPSPNTLTLSQTSSLTDILAAALESTQNFDPTQEMSPFLLPTRSGLCRVFFGRGVFGCGCGGWEGWTGCG
ncbi:hypothetical protein BCR33DRAFT_262431 [Rhizoclosmatium globosum]|uniref:Uncharacterized protein n=1 Tax=Rhizoclosmatium globosum TaxID=329046 RepID=A0A1Y2C8Y7_9FUNG|nr:hypothetical protein BCR33DRAFT_262431 [Rhizoclosmatium globosum]|eukprot:ORY43488.1 hypothetical protein BCR33DRAFT_262431 [Rhizoclosmatium globosum]